MATAAPPIDAAVLPERGRHLPPTLAVVGRSWHYGRTKLGVVLTASIILLTLIGPFFAPWSPTAFAGPPYGSPTSSSPLGTDFIGHDVLSTVLYGGRSILWMAFASVTLGVAIGVILGVSAGYSRNGLDDLIMRGLDIQYAFPGLVFVLLVISLLGHSLWLLVLLIAIGQVPGVARITRGVALEAATREYVEAAEVLGVPRRRILLREIMPNLMTPLLVEYSLRLTWAIGGLAALSFLGFGVQPPQTDWGLMINQNRVGLTVQPWPVVIPILCIAVFTIGTNLIGEGLSRAVAGIDQEVNQG